MNYYMADFETTTQSIDIAKSQVWLWGLSNIFKEERYWDIDIDSFFSLLETFKQPTCIYFHNLDWDGSFILHWLGNNYTFKDTYHEWKRVGLGKHEFAIFAGGANKFYRIWFKNQHGTTITFVCSYRILNYSVSGLMGVKEKDKIDYDLKELPKSKEDITQEQLDYLWNDIDVVAKFMNKYLVDVDKKASLTSGSTSVKLAKEYIGSYKWNSYFVDQIQAGYFNEKGVYVEGEWDKIAPAIRGGYTFVKRGIENQVRKKIIDIDINSCYTYMIGWEKLPIGKPIWKCTRINCKHLSLYKVVMSGKVKPLVVPFVSDTFGNEQFANYLSEFENLITYVPDFYLNLIKKYYDLTHIKATRFVCFNWEEGIFKDYVLKLLEQKNNAAKNSYEYNSAKIYSHSIPGKMGSNPRRRSYYFEEYDPTNDKHNYASTIRYGKYVFNYRYHVTKASYSPLFIWVVHYGRAKIIDAIQQVNRLCTHVYKDGAFNYCDTDSIKMSICDKCYEKLPEFIDFDQKRVGAFSLDGVMNYGYYVKRKLYIQFNDFDEKLDSKHCGCAGLTKTQLEDMTAREFIEKIELNKTKDFEWLKENDKLFTKKQKIKVDGGLILVEKEIKI